jgi:O-acetyl-ADP-ribose deacetylase (regulator of RNase III)
MIKEVEGDILLTKAQAFAHGVAIDDDFKHGLSLQLKEQWPSMYKDFRHFCKTHAPQEGDVWSWKGPGTPVIFNLFTQAAPHMSGGIPSKASLSNVNRALKNLVKELNHQSIKSLAITKIGTGVGGLDWHEVMAVLNKDLASFEGNIFVYSVFKAKMAAKE